MASTSHSHAGSAGDLVVLTDALAPTPDCCANCTPLCRTAVRVRDGAGLAGPLVIPGVTSVCCAPICTGPTATPPGRHWPPNRGTRSGALTGRRRATARLALGQLPKIVNGVR